MAHKYAKKFPIPEGFPSLLKEFTREVLREQPENIYAFGFQYFSNISRAREAGGSGGGSRQDQANSIRERVATMFQEADVDGNGYLDQREFKYVWKDILFCFECSLWCRSSEAWLKN